MMLTNLRLEIEDVHIIMGVGMAYQRIMVLVTVGMVLIVAVLGLYMSLPVSSNDQRGVSTAQLMISRPRIASRRRIKVRIAFRSTDLISNLFR